MGKWKRCTRKTKNNGNNEQSNILLTALLTMKTVSCRWYIVVKDSKYETTLFIEIESHSQRLVSIGSTLIYF